MSQINRANVACNLLALLKSDDSDLVAANASHFLCMLPLGDDRLARAHTVLIVGRRRNLCKPIYRYRKP